MTRVSLVGRALAAFLLTPACAAFASGMAPADPMLVGSTAIATVTPHVPVAAGTPCVANLFTDTVVYEQTSDAPGRGSAYSYIPPAGCHGPWAKVVLKVTVNEEAGGSFSDATKAYLRLGGVQIFEGSLSNVPTQMHPMPADGTWRAERDVTDLAALFAAAHNGQVGLTMEQDIWPDVIPYEQAGISAQLLFYPASAATPAQKTPDAVFGVQPYSNSVSLPHNIVRAYLDVYNTEPWWFTCVTHREFDARLPFDSPLALGGVPYQHIFPPAEGCFNGGFAEIGVNIDGTPAGVAPVFPLLSSNTNPFLPNTFNAPIQPPQTLNYMPYRVDLSPFAAILNEAGDHTITLSRPASAYLLVYQDRHSTRVSGAVTINTLAGSPGSPTVTDSITSADDAASGQIATSLDRDFRIHGYVNTSNGRVDSNVHQTSHFQNTQVLYLDGLHGPYYREYRQHLQLDSQTQQHSRRTRAGVVLNDDVVTASYPLDLSYDMHGQAVDHGDGPEITPTQANASVDQHFDLQLSHQKGGFGTYTSQVRNGFHASRVHDFAANADTDWQAQSQFRFNDNQGSCYQSALTAINGAVATEDHGVGCPNGRNKVRWFAHPDGSPDGLGWVH
jgi:hypothetical protein